jgi:hypothetical protein
MTKDKSNPMTHAEPIKRIEIACDHPPQFARDLEKRLVRRMKTKAAKRQQQETVGSPGTIIKMQPHTLDEIRLAADALGYLLVEKEHLTYRDAQGVHTIHTQEASLLEGMKVVLKALKDPK